MILVAASWNSNCQRSGASKWKEFGATRGRQAVRVSQLFMSRF